MTHCKIEAVQIIRTWDIYLFIYLFIYRHLLTTCTSDDNDGNESDNERIYGEIPDEM